MKNKLYQAPKISIEVIFLEESLAAGSPTGNASITDPVNVIMGVSDVAEQSNLFYEDWQTTSEGSNSTTTTLF